MKRIGVLLAVCTSIIITALASAQGTGQLTKVRIGTGRGCAWHRIVRL